MTSRPTKPVVIVNPRSGGGKAARFDLVAQCRARAIDPIVFEPGDDLAAEHDLPYVCVPAGTRNHFALDLGIDPNDVVGALDAFSDGGERRIDLGRVNGRAFVNNVAMGVYGAVVQSSAYREHKVRTVIDMMPELIGPDVEPFDLRFVGHDGRRQGDHAVPGAGPEGTRRGRRQGSAQQGDGSWPRCGPEDRNVITSLPACA